MTRIISLIPSATDIIVALGRAELLVGVTHECDAAGAMELPSVTRSLVNSSAEPSVIDAQVRELSHAGSSLYEMNEPLMREVRPDVILTQALCDVCAVMETDVRAVAARMSPQPQVIPLSATSLDGIFDDIVRVAAVIDAQDEGEELLAGMRARMRAVHLRLKGAKAPRPRVAIVEWTDPIFPGGHWVPEMVRRAGGIDVLMEPEAHSVVRPLADVAAANPEIVIIAPCGYALDRATTEARTLIGKPGWEFLDGRAVWAIDANAFTSRPGPRVVDGIDTLARIFNPSLFTPLDPAHATRVA